MTTIINKIDWFCQFKKMNLLFQMPITLYYICY